MVALIRLLRVILRTIRGRLNKVEYGDCIILWEETWRGGGFR